MADGSSPSERRERSSPYVTRISQQTTLDPSPTEWRNSKPKLSPAIPPGWAHWVAWARSPANWLNLRSKLPPILMGLMPPKPPRDTAEAWRVLYEFMWLRAVGQTMLVPAERSGIVIGAYGAPVEHRINERTIQCKRAAPMVKLERSRYGGWRFAPEILTASFQDGPQGEEGERSRYRGAGHLGGDIGWDGVDPAPRRKPDKPGDRVGLARFDYGGSAVLLEVESITKLGADGELTVVPLTAPPTDWRGWLIREAKRAKAEILAGGRGPRPADVLRAVPDVPSWVTPAIVRYLIAVTSWQTGGQWQRSADFMMTALKSERSFHRFALRQLERVALRYFDPTPGADNQHSVDTLARAHGLIGRKPQVGFRARLLELSTTTAPDRQAARADLIKLYKIAIE